MTAASGSADGISERSALIPKTLTSCTSRTRRPTNHGTEERHLRRSRGRPVATTTTNCGLIPMSPRSEEHTSELQSQSNLVCRLLLEKKKKITPLRRTFLEYFLGVLPALQHLQL